MNRDRIVEIVEQIEEITRFTAKGGQNVMVTCPFAGWHHSKGRDSRPSCGILVVDDDESIYNCFACGKAGSLHDMVADLNVLRGDAAYEDLEELVLEYEEIDFEKIIDRAGEEPRKRFTRMEKEDLLEARPEEELDPFRGDVPAYAATRGLDPETCKVWEIGHDRQRNRLVFPVRRRKDKALVGITGRSLINETPKYWSGYFDWATSKYLYGEWMISDHAERVVVVEGPIDVIALWKAGESALGIMGAFASSFQVRKLEYLELPIFLFPDGDKAGARWANTLGDELRELGCQVRDVQVKADQDPSDLEAADLRKLLRNAPMRI